MNLLQFLLYALILSFCFGQFGKLPSPPWVGGGEVGVYLWDILAAALVFYWLALRLGVKKRVELPSLWVPIFLFSFISLVTLINGFRWLGVGEWVTAAAYWVRWVIYAGVYFVVSDISRKIPNTKCQIPNTLVLSGAILAVIGFIQLIVFPDLTKLDSSLGWDPHQGRMVSTWLDPNFLGAYFVLCLALLTGKIPLFCHSEPSTDLLGRGEEFLRRKEILRSPSTSSESLRMTRGRRFFPYLLLTAYYLILSSALLLTFSRSAWAMFAIVIGIFGLFKSRKLLVLMVVMFFGAYFFVPRVQTRLAGVTDPADSASLRLVSWQQTFEIIKDHPLIGVGFNAFRYAQERGGFFRDKRGVPVVSGHAGAGSDSSLLLVWATTGIFGLLAYLWLYGSIVWKTLRSRFSEKNSKFEALSSKQTLSTKSEIRNGLVFRISNLFGTSDLGFRISKLWVLSQTQNDHYCCSFLSLSLLAALAGLLIGSNFINSLFYPPILLWLWIVAGLVV